MPAYIDVQDTQALCPLVIKKCPVKNNTGRSNTKTLSPLFKNPFAPLCMLVSDLHMIDVTKIIDDLIEGAFKYLRICYISLASC